MEDKECDGILDFMQSRNQDSSNDVLETESDELTRTKKCD